MRTAVVALLASLSATLGSCESDPASPATPCNESAECGGGQVCVHAGTGEVLGSLALKADCTCDYNPVCEAAMKCSSGKCSCDPECNHGEACGADGHCDTWCPTGVDADCAGSPDDGKYCASEPAPPTSLDAGTGGADVTGAGAQPDPVQPTFAGTCAPSPSSAAPGVGGSGGDPGACGDPGAKTKASCKEDGECGPVLTCMKPCPSCEKTCNLPCGTGDEGDALCASYGAGICPEKTCTMCFPVCSKPPTRCTPL
ncbi:MAG: hypothetical protein AMXMBFR64_35510 [Myxococcales bacterium]